MSGAVTERSAQRVATHATLTPRQSIKQVGAIKGGLERVADLNNYLIRSGMKTQRQATRKEEELTSTTQISMTQHKTDRRRSQPNMGLQRKQSGCHTQRNQDPNHLLSRRDYSPSGLSAVSQSNVNLNLMQPEKKYSAAESQKSGRRLHENALIYEAKRQTLLNQRTREIEDQMQEKPVINKNTNKILSLKLKFTHRDGTSHSSHIGCYFNQKQREESEECTHKPVINGNSEYMVSQRYVREHNLS